MNKRTARKPLKLRPVAARRKPRVRRIVLFEGQVRRQSEYFTVELESAAKFTVTVTGTGNVDLYVKLGRKPTIYNFDRKATGPTSDHSITYGSAAPGVYHVRLRPMAGLSEVKVVASILRFHLRQ